MIDSNFRDRVEVFVAQIPKGRVMSYGQLAALCGNPRSARIVGGIAHFGDPDLPWQRVVNKSGGLAVGYPGGVQGHKKRLEAEGVTVDANFKVEIGKVLWRPQKQSALIVIVGETASGKSALAVELAEKFNGEIICADSRTVYKGMDIGTAKTSQAAQKRIKHHLLDVVMPDQNFTAAEFKELANKAINDICKRGRLPIMVGGTGLYVDGVIYDFGFEKQLDKKPIRPNTLVVGLSMDRDTLKQRIQSRTELMIKKGLLEEVKHLSKVYGWHIPAMTAIGYREFQAYFAKLQSLDETTSQIERNTFLYAKRQRTWFKRNESIQWVSDPKEVVDLVTTFLNKKQ